MDENIYREIVGAFDRLKGYPPGSQEYDDILKHIKALNDLKKQNRLISPDVLVSAGVSILGILLVLNFERLGVITSKALMFVRRS